MHASTTDLAEKSRISAAMIAHEKAYSEYVNMTSNMNWSQLEAMADRAMKNKDINEHERKKIINAVDAAKDALKDQYSQKAESDQDTSVILALKEYQNILKLKDTKIGKKKNCDAKGNIVIDATTGKDEVDVIADSEIKAALADVVQLSKLKKKFTKIVDAENLNINLALSNGTIDDDNVYYFADDGITRLKAKGKSLLELERIISDRQTKVEELNKATEKLIESYVSDKENAERHKHIANLRNKGGKS